VTEEEAAARLAAAAAQYASWTDDELGDEMALRRDNGEDTDKIGLAIIARGGNPMPTPAEQSLHYEVREALRGTE
jgi:hypothetical protein